ncbi:MAG: hypothetical protein JW958_09400 [Candidatus Eisenbacteria bacterium]|nr:hypothetical protein [Candidatus Eisenbacteria bacterium]
MSAVEILIKNRRIIVINTAVVVILAILISLLLPKWYRSTATILPPESSIDPLTTLGAIQIAATTANLPWFATTSDVYGAILESRHVSETLIRRYGLMRIYDVDTMDKALKKLSKHRWIRVTDEGMVEVVVEARDPERAAGMANALLEILDDFNQNTRMTDGKKTRDFVAGRLKQTRGDLEATETALKEFQEKYGAVEITVQTEALISAAAEIEGEIRAIDVQLSRLSGFATESFPEVRSLRIQKRNLERQLEQLIVGTELDPEFTNGKGLSPYPAFKEIPDVGVRYVRLMREVEIQSKILAFLSQELERAKILASRDTPTIQVLDRAVPPDKKYRPRRSLIVIVALAVSLLGSVVLVFGLEAIDRWKSVGENRRRWNALIHSLKDDWFGGRTKESPRS